MKLIFCVECNDIVRLIEKKRQCECGESWGYYTDYLNAKIGGRCLPLGIDNPSLKKALNNFDDDFTSSTHFSAFIIGEANSIDDSEVNHDAVKKKITQNRIREYQRYERIYSAKGVF